MHAGFVRFALALAAAQIPLPAGAGGAAPAAIRVSAEVAPSAVFRFETGRSAIEVSPDDVKRGFVEITAASLLRLETGRLTPVVVLDFSPESGPFKSVEMRTDTGWLAAALPAGPLSLDAASLNALPATGAIRAQDPAAALVPAASAVARAPGSVRAAVSYRFNLAEDAGPGIYRLPLTLNIGL